MTNIIYQTPGIVLNRMNFGEADNFLIVFTEKFGKIKVIAKGSRHLKSKLRYNLETFSYSRFGLIGVGGGTWKLIDADEIIGKQNIVFTPERLMVFSNISNLLNRMIQGEEQSVFLWNEIKNLFEILSKDTMLSETELKEVIEIPCTLRMLDNLGYLEEDVAGLSGVKAIQSINRAIKESML